MKIKLFILSLIIFTVLPAFAIMPSDYYEKMVNESEIKTPAVVKKIRKIDNKKGNIIYRVYFESMYQTPEYKFNGVCYSFKKNMPWDEAMEGRRFYYPVKNSEVFVTVSKDGGFITSLIVMDEKFKEKLKTYPETLKYNAWGAYFAK
ncbi:MAG: hypothetical protein PHV68_01570 [Candidatus Gastranaerophilales bacterium]|nr:hypothetical protein [Candidatus Gastranaerophilales bacterium]